MLVVYSMHEVGEGEFRRSHESPWIFQFMQYFQTKKPFSFETKSQMASEYKFWTMSLAFKELWTSTSAHVQKPISLSILGFQIPSHDSRNIRILPEQPSAQSPAVF